MNIRIYILILSVFASLNTGTAQSFKKNRVGYLATIGLSTYQGELANNFQSFTFKPSLGLGINYRLNPYLSVRAEMDFFKLSGGSYNKYHSLSFTSNNAELSTIFIYNLLPEIKGFKYRKDFSPYVFAGIGIDVFKTNISQDGKNPDFRVINNPGVNGTPILPFGIGFKVKTGAYTDILIEVGYRKTFTRTLDNVRSQYLPESTSSIVSAGDIASEPKIKHSPTDGYFMTSIKIIYSPDQLFKRKVRSATPQAKWMSKKNKTTSRQIARNKKLASDKVIRLASNQ